MREAVLGRYGDFLAGRRVSDVEAAVARVVSRHLAVDGGWARLIDRLRAAGATVHLVTDAPAHVARAYARKLGADPEAVHGTGYPAADGRYTGAFDPVDKAAVAAAARPADGRLVAAGDSAVDLRMRASADLFFAVAGEGDVAAALAGLDPAPVTVDDFCAAPRVGPPPGPVVLVDDARAGAAAVERALVAAGLVEPPTP
jgi:phosphoserine phosphatase